MIRFVEIINQTRFNPRMERTAVPQFSMGEVWINEKYVVSIREATGYRDLLTEGRLPTDLDHNHRFTTVVTNNGTITETHVVVGDPTHVALQLNRDRTQLLKG